MDFYEDERELESDENKAIDKNIVDIDIGELVLPVPRDMLEERMKIMFLTESEAIKDIEHLAKRCLLAFSHNNIPREEYTQRIFDYLDSEAETYR